MKKIKTLSILLAITGLVLATLLVGWFGAGKVAAAVLSIGIAGFGVFCGWQICVMLVLGFTWWTIVPDAKTGSIGVFIRGRMVRDSAASCLPFSPAGGFILGARAVTLYGVSPTVATLSTIADLTTEFASEIVFAAFGLIVLLQRSSDRAIVLPAEIGLAIACVVGLAVLRLQKGIAPWFMSMGRRILKTLASTGQPGGEVSDRQLAATYGDTRRLAVGTALHLLGWFGKGIGNYLAFQLLGADIDLAGALAIEGLLHVMLAAVVLVPGYAGVQEAGYAGLGALFGVPADISLAVSLVRRARDIAIGIPVLLVWQFVEARRRISAAP
jgi:putative membrane protein